MSTTEEVLPSAVNLVGAFGRHDAAAYFGCLAPEATFIFYTTPARLASRAEYERLCADWKQQDEFRVLSCESPGQAVQVLGDAAIFCHDVTTVVRTTAGEQTVRERESIVFRIRGDRSWAAVHKHLSPHPDLVAE